MSNVPPNPLNNATGPPQLNANPGPPMYNQNQQFAQVPLSQLPPGYVGLKQDGNSNSPTPTSVPQNNVVGYVQNNFSHSASSSPAFNHPGMMPPPPAGLPPQSRPPMKPLPAGPSNQSSLPPPSSVNPYIGNANVPSPYPPSFTPQHHINDNAPPLIPSSQYNQPMVNRPPMPGGSIPQMNYPPSSNAFSTPPMTNMPSKSVSGIPPFNAQGSVISKPPAPSNPTSQPYPGQPMSGPPRNSPLPSGPPRSSPLISGPSMNGPPGPVINGPGLPTSSSPSVVPQSTGPSMNAPLSMNGPPNGPLVRPPLHVNGPPSGLPAVPPMGPHRQGVNGTSSPGQPGAPLISQPQARTLASGPTGLPPMSGLSHPGPPMNGPLVSGPHMAGPHSLPTGLQGPSSGPQSLPPMGHMPQQSGYGAPSNMQNRYPQMPQSNLNQQPQPMGQYSQGQYPQQYNTQGVTQQMGQLSVTKQGFDQLWGHQMVDLVQCRHIMPEYPEDPPEIKLANQFADSPNCHPDIFRCTINRIPETNNLLQKSRLPLGILIHPFKDLNHLPVIQCTTIVRCRACRTYINPFVYFVDAKRWKCNLCYRVNDLPEEFQYDPVSKSYGDPSRRPEIKSATIEFIAPGEYMLRPPQPAVYLFLLDVSQIARDSGYLQVFCSTLLSNLDELPGDARTQVGFICYDAHIHYYLMSDELTRPKEMTVLDIDDVFLPSPESLLVNLSERRELVKELLNVLPQRYSNPGAPSCALGAALQAAYKLMAPTGGRITVFQTCLPNAGPGALQPREDPNARSSKDVQHLNPATDFYKRIALDCSGAQIAVDLFLLSSQYSDLASLSGMSKFSAGTVYYIPLFKASRSWQVDQLDRMLSRYLTRKIGFEAVMRVRCTRGITIHTFHGNFFVRSTDLLSLPNVSPDAGFGMQLTIEESLSDLQQVCFQAALLYTSSKGERRIRVHTLALPIASNLPDVLHSADQHCIIGLLSKMAVDRCVSASMVEAREALTNVAIDALSAFRLAQNLPVGSVGSALHAPLSLRLLPAFLLALLKRKAFRTGTSTRLDDRVADMCDMKTLPLSQLLRRIYPHLYPIHNLLDEEGVPDPPKLSLTAERINANGAYLLDDCDTMIIYVGHLVSPAFLSEIFGVTAFSQLPDEARSLPRIETDGNEALHAFIDKLNDDRPYASNMLVLRDNSPSRQLFTERLVDDRVESSFSYYEFLQHVKNQVK